MISATLLTRAVPRRCFQRSSVLRKHLDQPPCLSFATLPREAVLPRSNVNLDEGSHDLEAKPLAKTLKTQLPLYWKLAKGKLTVWVSVSAMPGYLLAVPGAIEPMTVAALACGTFLTSSSAQTMNQMIEVPRDAKMLRTKHRPLPSGKLSRSEAACFAAASGISGLGILAVGATPATAAIAATTMALYAGMYTPMKVRSEYNTHVGAISGSLPTLMGFTAALGTGLVASPWAPHAAWIFGMQTLWQMPHFYALAWIYRADYLKGGYKMFPLTDTTGLATAAMSKPYLAALTALPWAMAACGHASWMLPVGAVLPSALWLHWLRAFEANPSTQTCRRFFLGSLSYLLAMLSLFTVYAQVGESPFVSLCPAAASDEDGDDNEKTLQEPAWRAKMKSCLFLKDACPHQQVCKELLGEAKQSCPISRDPLN
eukprot:TRINITY_DN10631_c2_g2_i1.p1 TRINITY_DN10631_c2_g2~~TRINITY_DN10631_c2_g2_i1.p1  ORF type:complete len:427 (+),score=79.17 TRINITY_DN10631_c2_g2_i1:225-1505(+)